MERVENQVQNSDVSTKVSTIDTSDVAPAKKYSLDDAIRLTGNGKFHFFVVVFSGLALMGSILENVSISFVLPYANCDLHLTTTEQGLVASIPFLGIIASSHLWGFLTDTWGRRKVIRLASISAVISSLISSFMTNVPLLIAIRFVVGICVSGLQASVFSYVSEFHTEDTAPRATSFASMFIPLMNIYVAIVGYFIIPIDLDLTIFDIKFSPWRIFMILMAFVNLFSSIVFIYLPESPKFLLSMNQSEKTLDVLRRMYAVNTGESKDSYPVKELQKVSIGNSLANTKGFVNVLKLVWNQTKPIFVPPYLDSTAKLSYMVFVLFAIGHGTWMWFPDFLIQLQENSGSGKTLCEVVGHERIILASTDECTVDHKNMFPFQLTFVCGVIFTTISALISFYLDKVGPRILVPAWLTLSTICCAALNYLTETYSIVISFITFLSSSLCASIVSAISVSLFPTNIRAMATCFIFMLGRAGGLTGSNLVGLLVEHNCDKIFYVFTALTISCVPVFLSIKKAPNANEHHQDSTPKVDNNENDIML